MKEKNGGTQSLMEHWLELIDRDLAAQSEPVHGRPLLASMHFVEHAVVSVEGGTLDDYLTQQWFGSIVRQITEWYRERYGVKALEFPETTSPAVIQIHDTPFEVRIPINPTRPGERPGTSVIHFVSHLLDDEDPIMWIESPPNLDSLGDAQIERLRENLVNICTLTRSIHNGLSGATFGRQSNRALASSAPIHLERGVKGILSAKAGERSISVWEFHLAVEKLLKLYLLQRDVSPPNTHDLVKLSGLTEKSGMPFIGDKLKILPSHHDAIRNRYGEISAPRLVDLFEEYHTVLEILSKIVAALERGGLLTDHSKVVIQALPWHPSRTDEEEE